MKDSIFADLWYNYFLDQCSVIKGREEKESVAKIATLEKELLAELSPEQGKRLEEFAEAIHDANSFLVEKAFQRGIQFSTRYLLEALERK